MQKTVLARRATVGALLIASASGCAGNVNLTSALDCAALIPPSVRKPVEDVPPPLDNSVGGWVAVADARSGKLDEANAKTVYVVESVDLCQAESKRLQRRPWWAIFG